ncbi:SAM-dependent methyltransferase [Nonlabens sp. YIK11]|uniref:tRNA (5-methylaminomethyl-2-thiouridine)(34)-methyltransferase MnmD n=1 Tax=Nonlabens sp. YIK11 TaxID=1453349 RepID=UPI0006DC6D07|nr:tRNA (5-methylaminomethyl-2-thiouridine)(34)-methyltransferase MnmD [Nonlabens sp. YIK11]KQC33847.1 SAM-dependent methyltransferase [Nonlabens sp. YIK11]
MKREIMTTGDGSKTIHMPDLNEQYHSKHGALQEARHVFIKMGLEHWLGQYPELSELHILEYGFGTGLNALLTAVYEISVKILYTGMEAFPVTIEEIDAMDYGSLIEKEQLYKSIHQASWDENVAISDRFQLVKQQMTFESVAFENQFDLVYFDAFGPRTQPELWELSVFKAAFKALKNSGVLVTYCAAGQVRRNLQEAGFLVERLPGPPGKREMLRATKA